MKRQELIDLGFKELPHFTIGNSLIYDLGRNRHLTFSCISDPNETIFICESDPENYKTITDLVCLHNYDYDGYIDMERLKSLIAGLTPNKTKTSIPISDIRNKMNPITNLISMIENGLILNDKMKEIVLSEIEQCKISINYLTNYDTDIN